MKKHLLSFSSLVVAFFLLMMQSSCIKDNYYGDPAIGQRQIELNVGDTYQLTYGYNAGTTGRTHQSSGFGNYSDWPQSATDFSNVIWRSSDTSIATVSATGLVTGVSVGECKIAAYYGTTYDVCRVKVVDGNGSIPSDPSSGGFTDYGAVNSLFSVANGKQIRFSRGNLQYQASTDTWRFAEQQYKYIGDDNANISATNEGWIDLFAWGTSGWNSGATEYLPYATSTTNADYYPGGDFANDLLDSNANADWGQYNSIAGGGDQAGMWRTLTSAEWNYLLGNSSARQNKAGKAVIDSLYNGIVLLPDNFTLPTGVTFAAGLASDWYNNNYTAAQWAQMENAGAVFIPAAGYREGTAVTNAGSYGYYWSATHINATYSYALYFFSDYANATDLAARAVGRSVRLVVDK